MSFHAAKIVQTERKTKFFFVFLRCSLFSPKEKDSAKFRFSEGNENKFSFLSVRKLIKSNEKPNFPPLFYPSSPYTGG